MKHLFLLLGLPVALWLPLNAHADTKLLVEYEGDTHTIVKKFTVPSRGVPAQRFEQKNKPLPVPQNTILLSWENAAGTSSTLMDDPRIVRPPLTKDGQGHGGIIIQEKGAYILTIKDEDFKLDTLKISFPGAQNSTKLAVSPDLD